MVVFFFYKKLILMSYLLVNKEITYFILIKDLKRAQISHVWKMYTIYIYHLIFYACFPFELIAIVDSSKSPLSSTVFKLNLIAIKRVQEETFLLVV
jgi:hypothetical protein